MSNIVRLGRMARPMPPTDLLGIEGAMNPRPVQPALDLGPWARQTFIDDGAPLQNPDHTHLQFAEIGFLWCSIPNSRQMNAVVGQAEQAVFRGGKWQKARQEQQLEEWFGSLPHFIITIHADYAAQCDDASFCALIEHELYHCGQQKSVFGAPKFKQNGEPMFGIRGHDVEEFVGVVERYGVGAAAGRTADLVRAANKGPDISEARIYGACGTCGRRIA